MTYIEKFTEAKNKMAHLLLWEPLLSEFIVQKNDSLALIIELLYLKKIFLKWIVVCRH